MWTYQRRHDKSDNQPSFKQFKAKSIIEKYDKS